MRPRDEGEYDAPQTMFYRCCRAETPCMTCTTSGGMLKLRDRVRTDVDRKTLLSQWIRILAVPVALAKRCNHKLATRSRPPRTRISLDNAQGILTEVHGVVASHRNFVFFDKAWMEK
jgi:hypothetical protein